MLALLGLLFTASFNPQVLTVNLETVPEPPKVWTQEMVKELAIEQAEKFGLHKGRFLNTLECENGFNATGQSEHYYKGKREQSFGAAQINLPSHPTITKEMAENPAFAVPWMAKQFSIGNAGLWSCFRDR